ncbi:hypothetical protein FBALC1_14472 [Flavobacteriales bacterium ALC-1]|nr:hypothetical protein FBALC1_14472 [Flavobacteriales bacterium ALC-1]
MGEVILEIIAESFYEIIPNIIKLLGASIRYCFFLGKKNFKIVFKEEWNKRVGFLTIVIVIGLIIW